MKKREKIPWYGVIKEEAGLTLAEIMVVVAILSTLSLLFYSLVVGTARTNMRLEAENMLTSYGQRTINILKSEVSQSRRIYENDTDGNNLLQRITNYLPSDFTPITNSRLPISDSSVKKPEAIATGKVGNSLFILQDTSPYILKIGGMNKYIIDLYYLNYYFLSEKDAGNVQIGSMTKYLNLIKFQSIPYASYQQLIQAQNDLSADDFTKLTKRLKGNVVGAKFAIDLDETDVTNMFYKIRAGYLELQSNHKINQKKTLKVAPGILLIEGAKATGNVRYSVAYNKSSTFDIFEAVPKYADPQTETAPFGFEVVLIGSSSARQVTVRLVLAAGLQRQTPSLANDVTVMARSF